MHNYDRVRQVLEEIFNPSLQLSREDSCILLSELNKDSGIKQVKFRDASQAFGIKFDKAAFPGKVFKDNLPVCDAILFSKAASNAFILCCELKSSDQNAKAAQQLLAADCFLDYLKSLLLKNPKYGLDISEWSRRYFMFIYKGRGNTRSLINKKRKRYGHSTPSDPKKISLNEYDQVSLTTLMQ